MRTAKYGSWVNIHGIDFYFSKGVDGLNIDTLKASFTINKTKPEEIRITGTKKTGETLDFTINIELIGEYVVGYEVVDVPKQN